MESCTSPSCVLPDACSDEVNKLMEKWIDMVQKNGIWEHYNPETGRAYGAEGLGMSCLIVDWMARLGIVNIA